MPTLDRSGFLKLAATMGAILAWSCSTLRPSSSGWRERRDLFPQGGNGSMEPTMNLLLNHGVRSALEYARSGDLAKAHAASNPEMAPHLSFVDMGGHGYSTVRVDGSAMVAEFVCIPRPIERHPGVDGGPLRYRMQHEVPLWRAGQAPQMSQSILEGEAGLST